MNQQFQMVSSTRTTNSANRLNTENTKHIDSQKLVFSKTTCAANLKFKSFKFSCTMTNPGNNGTPTDGKMPFRIMPGSAKKGGRFAKVKRTPQSDKSNDPGAQTVKVVLVIPDNQSQTSIAGIVISPTGFFQDKFLADIMFRNIPEAQTQKFLLETGCVHRVFTVLDQDGKVLKKENRGKFYPIRSCFIPVEEPTDLNDQDRVISTVSNLADHLWATIDTKRFKFAKEEDLPKIVDYDRDVRTVTNFSDVIETQEDILMCITLSCKMVDMSFGDWIRQDNDDNLYTMFKRGTLDPELAAKWDLPFSKMSNEDKAAYQQYKENADQQLKKLSRNIGNELENESDKHSD